MTSMANSTSSIGDTSYLSKVNQLYGPGTVGGWYLTVLAVLVSWSLHPEKRDSDSISLDFIGVLMLPAVALGHFISLIYNQRSWKVLTPGRNADKWDDKLLPERVAAYAPYTLIRNYLFTGLVFGVVTTWPFKNCKDRASLYQLLAILCGGTVLMFSHVFRLQSAPVTVEENFVGIDWIFFSFFTGGFGVWPFPGVALDVLSMCVPDEILKVPQPIERDRDWTVDGLPPLTVFGSMLYSIFALIWSEGDPTESGTARPHLLHSVFPESSSSLKDLDQRFALATGAATLFFNCLSTVSARYKSGAKEKRSQSTEPTAPTQRTSGAVIINVTAEQSDASVKSAPSRVRRLQATSNVPFVDAVDNMV